MRMITVTLPIPDTIEPDDALSEVQDLAIAMQEESTDEVIMGREAQVIRRACRVVGEDGIDAGASTPHLVRPDLADLIAEVQS